ncbi:MAG: hypothetical protein C4524_06415 [Candidatus Zixiibacteriota bacterium]|nr:MAG: hypothetical protein C4524_06415 [candidate division Zixibacteria bacterium]
MSNRLHQHDCGPRWVTTKYEGACARCGIIIPPRSRAIYFPAQREILCIGHSREFTRKHKPAARRAA